MVCDFSLVLKLARQCSFESLLADRQLQTYNHLQQQMKSPESLSFLAFLRQISLLIHNHVCTVYSSTGAQFCR